MESETEEKVYSSDERMDVNMNERQLVCIEYPGIVLNADKALQTLGGVKAINTSIKDETKRLELRFRPEDLYCKPACGTKDKSAGLVLRVRRRRKKKPDTEEESTEMPATPDAHMDKKEEPDDGFEYRVEVLGTVSASIKFQSMCDFQYLPVARKADGGYENLLDKLVMTKFTQETEYMARKVPLFLSPVMFSRFDTPQDYGFLLKKRNKDTTSALQPSKVLAAGRKTRRVYTAFTSFTDPTPQRAHDDCLAHAEKFSYTGLKEALVELFEERPIWSRAALAYRLRHNVHRAQYLRFVLPSVAYFFLNGPWRFFWARMGYDPRIDPSAKKFQGIDFRRQRGPGEPPKVLGVAKKKDFHRKKDVASEINLTLLKETDSPEVTDSKEPQLRDFEFHADVLPPNRQMVYMVCDIFDAEVQALVSKNDGKETKCDERNGWCVANFTDRCRTIMSRHVTKLCPQRITSKKLSKAKRMAMTQPLSEEEDANVSMDTVASEDEASSLTSSQNR